MGIVSKRSSMIFYSSPTCHYSHRVRIVLAEKDITVDIEQIEGGQVPQEVLDHNPYGSLPTLIDRELTLYETKVMMEYLDERFPHPPLLPVYPVARALSRQFIHRIEGDWCAHLDNVVNKPGTKAAETGVKELRDSLVSIAPIFSEKPFFMSDEFTLVDCCLAPILWRTEYLGINLPKTRQTKPLWDYMERIFGRDSFQESLTELEREMRS